MSDYKLKTLEQHSSNVNESVAFTLLLPVIVVALGKLIGYTIAKFNNGAIEKSMENLTKSRFAEKSNERDIKNLYELIVKDYPDIKDALEKDNDKKLESGLRSAGLNSTEQEQIIKVIAKLKEYHSSSK